MEPRAGCRLPARVEQVVNGALVVTVSCGERRFAGVLLDCTKKSGLFGLPSPAPLPLAHHAPAASCPGQGPEEGDAEGVQPGAGCPPPRRAQPPEDRPPEDRPPEPPPPLVPPLPAGSLPPFPPYFEGAPFPRPLWLRSTYQQWVPQPPPRTGQRCPRRLPRKRDPGRLILSTIRLRPRRVLCERCKSTVSPQEAGPGPQALPRPQRRLGGGPGREHRRPAEREHAVRRSKRERREEGRAPGEPVPRSPVIKISFSTPQGKGEVVKIPSRVHGSREPFCPPLNGSRAPDGMLEDPRASGDRPSSGPPASVPKLKLTRPVPPGADLPPPKIRLKPHRVGGERAPLYRAELVEDLNGCRRGPRAGSPALLADGSAPGLEDASAGSSGEDEDPRRRPRGEQGRGSLTFLAECPRSRADCASQPTCSSDSLDACKSPGSDAGDRSAGDASAAPPSTAQTARPLTAGGTHRASQSASLKVDGRWP